MELLGLDAKKSGKTLLLAGALFALALGLAIATAVVLLLTLGAIIAEGTQLSVGASLLIATVIGMLLTAVSGVIGWKFGRNAFVAFDRSKGEFRQNLVWIKQAMKPSSRGHEIPER